MPVLTASDRTTLLKNVSVNLGDTASRHPDLAVLKHQTAEKRRPITPLFVPQPRAAPYVVVTPGPLEFRRTGNTRRDLYTVLVHTVHLAIAGMTGAGALLGTTEIDGIDTLNEAIIAALERPRPYDDGLHITANGYTTQTRVHLAIARTVSAPALVEGLKEQERLVKTEIAIDYLLTKA